MPPKQWQATLIACCLLLTAYWLPATGCTESDDAWQRVQDAGVLRVGLDPTYPPFENADTGELHGIDVDLARALGEELGVAVEFSYFGYDGLYDALQTEQVDVLISALVVDPTKTRDFAYSNPYFNTGQVLITRANTEGILEMEDLEGHTLAVELGSEGHVQATQWERRVPDLDIRPINTPDDALWIVLQGEADAALVDHVSGRLYLANTPALAIRGNPVTVEPYALVVRDDDESLLDALNMGLEALDESGRLNALISNWLDAP